MPLKIQMSRYTGHAALIASMLGTFSVGPSLAASVPRPLNLVVDSIPVLPFPPSTSYCLTNFGIHCYQPFQFAKAYNLAPLHAAGINGYGETIVIVVCFGSPTIANDLRVFDRQFGLPDPGNFTAVQPVGRMPAFDPTDANMLSWAAETTLDVEYAHVFAPGASIVLVETPVSETEGVQGFPEIVQAENYVIDHDLGDVITQSFGATEETFPNHDSILGLRGAFENAARHHVTVLAASGDTGATGYELDQTDLYPLRVNMWPATDPLVSSVGGTQLTLDDAGSRLAPDVVWSDTHGASGGGLSAVFARPPFQNGVQELVGQWRGTPDISMSAAVDGAAVMYYSFIPGQVGYRLVAGTSEASPEFAGIVAMADQVAGHRLGTLGDKLYALKRNALVDITEGNNTFGPFTNSDDKTYTVIGYPARLGYDLASGLGTVDALNFVRALARLGDTE
jgi:subtilase family serine protease